MATANEIQQFASSAPVRAWFDSFPSEGREKGRRWYVHVRPTGGSDGVTMFHRTKDEAAKAYRAWCDDARRSDGGGRPWGNGAVVEWGERTVTEGRTLGGDPCEPGVETYRPEIQWVGAFALSDFRHPFLRTGRQAGG